MVHCAASGSLEPFDASTKFLYTHEYLIPTPAADFFGCASNSLRTVAARTQQKRRSSMRLAHLGPARRIQELPGSDCRAIALQWLAVPARPLVPSTSHLETAAAAQLTRASPSDAARPQYGRPQPFSAFRRLLYVAPWPRRMSAACSLLALLLPSEWPCVIQWRVRAGTSIAGQGPTCGPHRRVRQRRSTLSTQLIRRQALQPGAR